MWSQAQGPVFWCVTGCQNTSCTPSPLLKRDGMSQVPGPNARLVRRNQLIEVQFSCLKKGERVTYLKIQLSTFLSMIIYTCILKISIIWTNPVICHLLQNEVLTTSRNNLPLLAHERMYQIFIYVPNIKKEIKKSEAWKAENESAPALPQLCSSAHQLLQGHRMLADFKMFIL